MKCGICLEESGTVGRGITLVRQGMVSGTQGMPKYIAHCNECMKKTAVQSKYEQASRGT